MSAGIKQGCSRGYTVLLRMYFFMLAFVSACTAVFLAVDGIMLGFGMAAAFCVMLCITAVAVPWCSRSIGYTRSGGSLCIERGLFVRKTIIISRDDIRYSEISRSPLERKLGICTVTFITGGRSVRLKGINFDDGRRLNYLFGGGAAE